MYGAQGDHHVHGLWDVRERTWITDEIDGRAKGDVLQEDTENRHVVRSTRVRSVLPGRTAAEKQL